MAGEGIADRGENVFAVLAGGGDIAADRVPVPGDLLGPEPAGDFLLGFRGADVPLRLVGSRRDPQVGGEPEDVVAAVAQAFEQVPAGLLLAAGDPPDLPEAEDDAVPERADERRGDIAGDGGQALAAGGARGVDEPLQRLGDLDRAVRAGVCLGGVGQVTQ